MEAVSRDLEHRRGKVVSKFSKDQDLGFALRIPDSCCNAQCRGWNQGIVLENAFSLSRNCFDDRRILLLILSMPATWLRVKDDTKEKLNFA